MGPHQRTIYSKLSVMHWSLTVYSQPSANNAPCTVNLNNAPCTADQANRTERTLCSKPSELHLVEQTERHALGAAGNAPCTANKAPWFDVKGASYAQFTVLYAGHLVHRSERHRLDAPCTANQANRTEQTLCSKPSEVHLVEQTERHALKA